MDFVTRLKERQALVEKAEGIENQERRPKRQLNDPFLI
jgi:hypothetical protein